MAVKLIISINKYVTHSGQEMSVFLMLQSFYAFGIFQQIPQFFPTKPSAFFSIAGQQLYFNINHKQKF